MERGTGRRVGLAGQIGRLGEDPPPSIVSSLHEYGGLAINIIVFLERRQTEKSYQFDERVQDVASVPEILQNVVIYEIFETIVTGDEQCMIQVRLVALHDIHYTK